MTDLSIGITADNLDHWVSGPKMGGAAAAAVTFFLDATGGNDANDGLSEGSAWQTLAQIDTAIAAGTIKAGDTIKFKKGETFSGTAQYPATISINNITLDAYGTGVAPILAGNATRTPPGTNMACLRVTGGGCHIQNLKFTTAQGRAIRVEGASCEINACEFTDVGSGIITYGANTLIHDNNFHDLKIAVEGSWGAVGIWFYNGCDGSRAYSNTFDTCKAGVSVDGGAVEFINTIDDVQVYNNFAVDCDGFAEFGADAGGTQSNIILYNNVSVNNNGKFCGISAVGATFEVTIAGVEFHHNTIIDTTGRLFEWFDSTDNPSGDNLVFKNNLVKGLTDFTNLGEDFTHEYNCYDDSGVAPASLGTGELVASHIDVEADYTLKVHTAGRQKGIASAYTTDYAGLTRSDPPDLGAYEYDDSAVTTLILQPDETSGIDTYIYQDNPTFNHGVLNNASVSATASFQIKTLLKFDLSSIPANATIVTALLTMVQVNEQNATDITVGVHRSLVEWFEGAKSGAAPDAGQDGSTWNLRNANGSVAWAGGAGGGSGSDYAASATDSELITGAGTAFNFDVSSDVQNFVSGVSTNRGWWLVQGGAGVSWKAFATSSRVQTGNRPKLTIEYTVP